MSKCGAVSVPARILLPYAALAAALLLTQGCERTPIPQAATEPQMPPPAVDVAPALARPVHDFEDLVGRLEATETVEVRSRVDGQIEKIHYTEGQSVHAGQLLITIDPRPFAAELARVDAELKAARSRVEIARLELARASDLLKSRLGSQQDFDQKSSELAYAEEQARSAAAEVESASLRLDYTSIKAPIEGRIARAEVTAGNLVRMGEPVLTRIVSENRVYAYFDVSERVFLELFRAASGPRAMRPNVRIGLEGEAGFPHAAQIDFVDSALNMATATMRVRAVLDNADRSFTPGLVARVRLEAAQARSAVLTPDRAIGTDQDKKFVLVVGAGDVAEFRLVRLGPLIDGMRVIESGLAAGERVIVNGLQRVRPGAPVQAHSVETDANGMPVEKPAAAAPAG